tara:strand:+ start:302 stop:820 length:519 start_codon:yes stop_codon:yes gene_type:complete
MYKFLYLPVGLSNIAPVLIDATHIRRVDHPTGTTTIIQYNGTNGSDTITLTAASVDSGTTTAAVVDTLTDSGQLFLTTVTVGDIIFPAGQSPDIYSTVTAIVDDETLTIEGTGNTLLEASGTAYSIVVAQNAVGHVLQNWLVEEIRKLLSVGYTSSGPLLTPPMAIASIDIS